MSEEPVLLSVVVPVYQGEAYLEELVSELERLRLALGSSEAPVELVEAILVDDGAIDGSGALIEALAARRPWVRPLRLSRNFGQHPATVAGILHSSGDWVVTLDEDLQHPPREVPRLLARAVETGADVVYAQPAREVHGSAFRDLSSRLFKSWMSRLTGNPAIRQFNSFRMIRGDVGRAAAAVSSHDSYFDVVLGWFTGRVASLDLPLRDRREASGGGSGYRLRSLLAHARRLLVSSEVPALQIGLVVGGAAVVLSALAVVVVAMLRLWSPERIVLPGWTSLIVVSLFFGGMLSLLAGVTLDYVGILVLRAHGRPTYFVVDRGKDDLLRPYLRRLAGD